MNGFNTPLEVRLIGEQRFKLTNFLEFENHLFKIIVHKDFEFDGASIPKSLWSVYGCPFGGLYSASACLHDALYATHIFSKKDSDKIWHRASHPP